MMATSLVSVSRDLIQARIADLRTELAEEELRLADSAPMEPRKGDNPVIRFTKYNGNYMFAAIKVGAYWFVTQDGSRTSRQGHAPRLWIELVQWIGERNWESIEVLS